MAAMTTRDCWVRNTASILCHSTSARQVEGDELPAAGDVLYRNPEAIANRLRLFHMLRLQVQERLDAHSLRRMADAHRADLGDEGADGGGCVRLTTYFCAGLPGVERQFDPEQGRISVKLSLSTLAKHWPLDARRLRLLVQSAESAETTQHHVTITVRDFPFRSQNRARGLAVVRDLLKEAQRREPAETGLSTKRPYPASRDRPQRSVSDRFPDAWLPTRVLQATDQPPQRAGPDSAHD